MGIVEGIAIAAGTEQSGMQVMLDPPPATT